MRKYSPYSNSVADPLPTCKRPPPPKLVVERLDPSLPMPQYAREGDSGFDVYAAWNDVWANCWEPVLIPLGIRAEIPEGYEIQIRPRSSVGLSGVIILNSPGTIDAGYRGEWKIPMMSTKIHHNQMFRRGERIAQAVLAPVTRANIVEGVVSTDTERSTNGFGSTGR